MQIHPLCAATPALSESDFRVLKADIAQRGQTKPITVCKGQIIDGRHRLRACAELGISPIYEHDDSLDEQGVYDFILSDLMHLKRVTTSQRAIFEALHSPARHGGYRHGKRSEESSYQIGNLTDPLHASDRAAANWLVKNDPIAAHRILSGEDKTHVRKARKQLEDHILGITNTVKPQPDVLSVVASTFAKLLKEFTLKNATDLWPVKGLIKAINNAIDEGADAAKIEDLIGDVFLKDILPLLTNPRPTVAEQQVPAPAQETKVEQPARAPEAVRTESVLQGDIESHIAAAKRGLLSSTLSGRPNSGFTANFRTEPAVIDKNRNAYGPFLTVNGDVMDDSKNVARLKQDHVLLALITIDAMAVETERAKDALRPFRELNPLRPSRATVANWLNRIRAAKRIEFRDATVKDCLDYLTTPYKPEGVVAATQEENLGQV